MKKQIRTIIGSIVVTTGLMVGAVAFVAPSTPASALQWCVQGRGGSSTTQAQNIPVTASSAVKVTNIVVLASGNDVRVQFDYALVNGATSGVVDASLQNQRSFNYLEVTGPGHYDATLTGLANGSYTIYVVSSGNPDYLVKDSAQSNQALVVTLPASAAPAQQNNGGSLLSRLISALTQLLSRLF